MRMLSNALLGAVMGLGFVSAANAYGPGNPPNVAAVPAGFTACGADGKVCKVPADATTVNVVYGTGSKFATAQGKGDFTCLPKGWVKVPSASSPQDLGVDDPAPNIGKTCYMQAVVANTTPAPAPAATAASSPVPAATPTKTYPNLAFAAVDADYETMKAMIAKMPHDRERTSSRGETALTVAVNFQNIDAVKALLEAGAKVNMRTPADNYHLLHLLARAKDENGKVAYTEKSVKIARMLWERCADRQPKDSIHKTPFEWLQKTAPSVKGTPKVDVLYALGIELKRIQDNVAPGCKY